MRDLGGKVELKQLARCTPLEFDRRITFSKSSGDIVTADIVLLNP
jgi:hypothetical protein